MPPKLKLRPPRTERAQLPRRLETEQRVVVEGGRGVEPARRKPRKRRRLLRSRPVPVVGIPRQARKRRMRRRRRRKRKKKKKRRKRLSSLHLLKNHLQTNLSAEAKPLPSLGVEGLRSAEARLQQKRQTKRRRSRKRRRMPLNRRRRPLLPSLQAVVPESVEPSLQRLRRKRKSPLLHPPQLSRLAVGRPSGVLPLPLRRRKRRRRLIRWRRTRRRRKKRRNRRRAARAKVARARLRRRQSLRLRRPLESLREGRRQQQQPNPPRLPRTSRRAAAAAVVGSQKAGKRPDAMCPAGRAVSTADGIEECESVLFAVGLLGSMKSWCSVGRLSGAW